MDNMMDLFGEVASEFQARLQSMNSLRVFGLGTFQARLLAVVGRRPGCSQSELAGWTGRDKAQVARTIKELESLGLLQRVPHETDWRSQRLTPTASGYQACALLLQERAALGSCVSTDLSPDERETIIRALTKMKHRLEADVEPDKGPALR